MKYSKDGYKRNSKDKNNPYNVIPSGNITMKDVDFPVFGMDNLGNSKVMLPGANYTFPGNSVFEIPIRKGVRKNPDGSESTHLMRAETIDGINWVSFPTLFQNLDGSWLDMSDEENWKLSMMEAKKRGELIYFGTDKKAALEFAEGSWKPDEKNIVDKQKTIPMLSDGGENDENPVFYSRLLKRFIPSVAFLAKNPLLTFTASMLYPKSAGKGSTLKTPSLQQQYQNYLNFTTPEERIKSELQYEVMTGRPFTFNPIPISDIKEHGGEHNDLNEKGINEFEINKDGYIETKKGYDEDALFDFVKDKYYKLNTADQKKDLVNKLNSPAFRERYKKNIFNITGENLSDEELTNRINQQVSFTDAGPDFHVTMPFITHSPKKGYMRNFTPYIWPFSGTDDEGRSIGPRGLDWRSNVGLYMQKDRNDEQGNLFGNTRFNQVTNPDFPELAQYPYIPQLNLVRDAQIMSDNQIRYHDDYKNTIVHEYAHSYNTDDSPLFNPAGKDFAVFNENTYGQRPGEKYKNWLSNLFGEDYFDPDKNKYGTWAMRPEEISSIKSETEDQLKKNNIWDHTKGEFTEANLNKMIKNNSRLNIDGPAYDALSRIGYTSLERMNYENKRNIRKQDDIKRDFRNNSQDFINTILQNENPIVNISSFNTMFNDSQSNLKDRQKYSDYNALLEDYRSNNKRKKKRATEVLNALEKNISNYINQEFDKENQNFQKEYNKKKNEVLPKMEMYFNEIAMDNQDGDETFARYGKELFQAKDGFDWKGYFKGEQGFIPDYGGKSTTETYQDVSKDVQKVADVTSMTGIPGVSQLAGYTSAGIDAIDAGIAYSQGDYDTAKKELGKSAAGALISTIPGGKTVAGLTKAGLQSAGKNLAKGTIKGGVKSTIKNIIGGNNDTPIYAENLEQPIDGGMLPEVTVTPKTKYGTELPIAQVGTFKTLAQKGLNAYNKYMFNKSKDAFGISGRMLMDDLTLPVANSANLMQHRSLANTYIPNLSGSDLNNYHKLITQYTINSEPFKFSSFPKNKEVSFPMQPSFMNEDGTPLYTFDNRFATQLNDIINSNKVIFKGDQNKPLTLVREFEGFTDVPVGKDFYFTKDYYGDMNKLNSYIDALKSGRAFSLNDISSWSVGANTGLNRFGSNRFIIEDFPLSQSALVNKYDSPLFSTNQKGIFRERELLLPSETQFKVKDIQLNVPRKPYHYTKDDAGKITDFSPHYGTDIILDVQTKKKGGQTKYKKSVFNKNKMSLSNPSRLINQMLKQGIFKAEFKMGGEQKLDNGYTVKKEFDNANNIPFISYTNEPDIEGRVYYEADNDAEINVIDIETKLNQIRSKHERTKKIILKRRQGESLSNAEKQHLNSLGLL